MVLFASRMCQPNRRHLIASLFLSFIICAHCRQLDWCHYWRLLKREHTRPECFGLHESRMRLSKKRVEVVTTTKAPIYNTLLARKNYGIEDCTSRFGHCSESKICENGLMCVQKSGYCCNPWKKQIKEAVCPSPIFMNVTCKAISPVTWCKHDLHCHSNPVRKCCPTFCGYNICI